MTDASKNPERIAAAVVIAIGAALVAVMLFVVLRSPGARPDIQARVVAVQVGRADLLKVTLEVEKPPLAEAECEVSAFDSRGFNVGRLVGIRIGPRQDDLRTNELSVNVPTDKAAVTARLTTCTITRSH